MSSATLAPCDLTVARTTISKPCRHPGATLAASILGSSLAFVDGSVVNIALPAIDRDLHAGAEGLAWLVSAYLLTLSALILMGGALGDHYGRRRMFLVGVSLFLVASLACAAGPALSVILTARAVQGIGAALLMPNSLALLGAGFDGAAKGRAIGTWAGVGALASAIGPVLGGWLVEAVGWRSIFLLNLPVGAAAAWLAWRFVPENRDARVGAQLDRTGALLVTVALATLTWALTAAAKPGGDTIAIAAAAGVGLVVLAFVCWIEVRRGQDALMPLFLMRDASFIGVTLLTFFLYAALGGLIVLLPFVLIQAEGYSPVAAGAAMLPIPILIGLGSRVMGGVAARIGGRLPLGIGALVVAAGLALYTRTGLGASDYWTDVLPATLMVAIGMAICVAPLTTTVMNSVDADHIGAASGFNSAVARIGGLIATALLGFVFVEQGARDALMANAHTAAWVGAVTAAVAGACALIFIRTPPTEPDHARMRPHIDDPARHSERARMRGVPQDGEPLGSSAHLPRL
jgi:EmrB/QacA subfamily drug resistance transporter